MRLPFSRLFHFLAPGALGRLLAHCESHTEEKMMETLMQILAERSGQQLVYSNLAQEINVATDTVKR